jgi:predicted O-methyltransferase YrrM
MRDFSGDFIHMKPLTLILALLVVSSVLTMTAARGPAVDPPTPGLNPKVQAVLDDIRKADSGRLAISAEDGRFLRLLVATNHTKQALEIGAASGYSAIWIGMGLRETGGRLVTIEYDSQRAKEAAANVARAGFSDIVRVVPGDAFEQIPKVEGQFDFVFLDAWKRDYQKFFDMVFPRMPKGGLFVAHNVLNKKSEMPDFLNTIETRPDLFSTIVAPSGEGVSVSWKRK